MNLTVNLSSSFVPLHTFPIFENLSLPELAVGRCLYNVYIGKSLKLCFPGMSRTIIYVHVYITSDFPITYTNASVLCQSESVCLH